MFRRIFLASLAFTVPALVASGAPSEGDPGCGARRPPAECVG